MFNPSLDSVLVSIDSESPQKDLEVIKEFYMGDPVKLTKVSAGGIHRVCQLKADGVNLDKLADSVVGNRISHLVFIDKNKAILVVINSEGTNKPKAYDIGTFVPAPDDAKYYLHCHSSDTKWILD